MKFFIGHLIGEEMEQYYNIITEELSEKFGIKKLTGYIPPHFTLKPPFEFENAEELSSSIEGITRKYKQIDFIVDGFGRYNLESRTIYLKVKEDTKLNIMVADIIKDLSLIGDANITVESDFRLHASIARHLTPQQSQEIWKYVSKKKKPKILGRFDNLALFIKDDDTWKVKNIFKFV